jgi:arylsulfatase A-like enzyme
MNRRAFLQGAASVPAVPAQRGTQLPNVVFLISDDHSAFDLGCYGNTAVTTPTLDRMSREGARMVNAFVSSAQCSPNRSSIFTGCTPHTTATSRLHTPLPDWEPSFLEPLKEKGYFTGAFRKVHQGAAFDKRWDLYCGQELRFEKFFDAAPKGRPFFLHVGYTDPHRPYKPGAFSPPHDPAKVIVPKHLPDTKAVRADLAHYYDYIARMDADCGRLFRMLEERGFAQNTVVFFTGDNGRPFPRAKGTCYDAGLNTPLLTWWPGRIPAGAVHKELIAHVDLPATFLDVAGISTPKKMQGRSFLPLVTGGAYQPRTAVFAERNWHDNFDPIRAVRTAHHKLILNAVPNWPYRPAWDLEDSPSWASIKAEGRQGRLSPAHMRMLDPARPTWELYDLTRDPDELDNVVTSAAYGDVFDKLKRQLSDWMHETNDYLPPPFRQYPAAERRGRQAGM